MGEEEREDGGREVSKGMWVRGRRERGGSESGEWGEGEGNKMAAKGEVAYRI